jgi:hypothetical protein
LRPATRRSQGHVKGGICECGAGRWLDLWRVPHHRTGGLGWDRPCLLGWPAAVTQIRHQHSDGRAYYEKRSARARPTKKRCTLKRLSDAIYPALVADAQQAATIWEGPGGQPGEPLCIQGGQLASQAPALRTNRGGGCQHTAMPRMIQRNIQAPCRRRPSFRPSGPTSFTASGFYPCQDHRWPAAPVQDRMALGCDG